MAPGTWSKRRKKVLDLGSRSWYDAAMNMRHIHIHRNPRSEGRPFYMKGRVPGRQTLIFIGGWLFRLAPGKGVN